RWHDRAVMIRAWRVHDTGLVAAPSRFRRLPGAVRHHQGAGPPWPAAVGLEVDDGVLRVTDVTDGADGADGDGHEVGRWPVHEVVARQVSPGPPVQFVVEVAGGAHLLAAPADAATAALLAALSA